MITAEEVLEVLNNKLLNNEQKTKQIVELFNTELRYEIDDALYDERMGEDL